MVASSRIIVSHESLSVGETRRNPNGQEASEYEVRVGNQVE